ncbi:MAG: translation initiation factor [Bacteroidales bacterium]
MNNEDWKDKLKFAYSTNPDYKPKEEQGSDMRSIESEKQQLRIGLEKKHRGGKTVSIITGFEGTEEELKELGRFIKSKCGVGGTVKDGEIIIQGDFRDRILNLLKEKGYKDVKKTGG